MTSSTPSIGFVSLGCPKALVDSEQILTRLSAEGYQIAPDYQQADLVVINTCGFIDSAVEESMEAIGEAIAENGKVIVTGCLGKRAEQIRARYPQVLSITGPHAYESVMQAIREHVPAPHDPHTSLLPPQGVKLTPRHYAYLKISEGCNHHCTFCIIPDLRGKLDSRPIGEVMDDAENLVAAGVKELLVVSQDTSAYGLDTRYRTGFWQGRPLKTHITELAQALGSLGVWVRMHYIYPYPHVDQLIPMMSEGLILPYLDIPLQHASLPILKAMQRPAATENTLKRILSWREQCPDLTLRSTFITGFPGETDADFDTLLDFIEEAQLDRVGCFTYSAVEGARANALDNPVPEELKQERQARLMALQAEISANRLQGKIGRKMQVLVDNVSDEGAIARSSADAPEIDGVVYIDDTHLQVGDWADVVITDADEHDLYARISRGQSS
ncbi:MAG: 30S ribosomal protein S12 methylthiotransferase RimO [Gammaproteobacteria bacterium]|nr:30S ribosomal protein S12 methylthiotransferase RimO [Gammaproteobacteria bacterium]